MAQIDAEVPWDNAPMAIAAVTPQLARDLGVARTTVTATDAAVGHTPAHALQEWTWSRLQELLDQGEIWRRADGRLVTFHELDGRFFIAVLAQVPGDRLGVVTLFQNSGGRQGGYVAKQLRGAVRIK